MNKRLLYRYEEVTYEALNRVCESHGARVFPKVRVADVFELADSRVSSEQFSYGLRSHFDFLVTSSTYDPLFSVEFDGPLHKTSPIQRNRDRLKNQLCERFNHGLLRINSRYLSKEYRGLDLLTFFVDAWFLEEAFEEAQRSGVVPCDEIFDVMLIAGTGTKGGKSWPYWLSLDIQLSLQKLYKEKLTAQMAPSHCVGADEEENYRCVSWLTMNASQVVVARTGMRAQRFPAVCKSELVSMLAMFDLYPKVQAALKGDPRVLVDRQKFLSEQLPDFQKRYSMRSMADVGASV